MVKEQDNNFQREKYTNLKLSELSGTKKEPQVNKYLEFLFLYSIKNKQQV